MDKRYAVKIRELDGKINEIARKYNRPSEQKYALIGLFSAEIAQANAQGDWNWVVLSRKCLKAIQHEVA